jgi:hypothetical protein
MKRRSFFRSLAAIAGIAFAEPLALLKLEPKWVIETTYYHFFIDMPPVYDKRIICEEWTLDEIP